MIHFRPIGVDEVRNDGGLAVDLERPGAVFHLAVCHGPALVLAQVLGPGLDDEGFEETARVGRVRVLKMGLEENKVKPVFFRWRTLF